MSEITSETNRPKCFVIMPIADMHGYEPGHFGRVYEHIIKPAILKAGYHPIRADDTVKTDYIVVGIIQMIVESAMVICDLSGRNANVMYELGIRHAFNKPVVLIKDSKTEKVFDIQGLRYMEYNESLRVDTVQRDTQKISSSILETFESKGKGVNSVVHLASIKAAEAPAEQVVTNDTQLILSAVGSLEKRLDLLEGRRRAIPKNLIFEGNFVLLDGVEKAEINDVLYDGKGNKVGVLADIHPMEDCIYIKQTNGNILKVTSESRMAKKLTLIPF